MHLYRKKHKKRPGWLRRIGQKLPAVTAAMTAVFLAGCGNGASQTGEATPSDGTIFYVKDAPGDLPSDLQEIRASGVLRVGIQSGDPPYYEEDPVSREPSGIDVDLAYEAASRIFGCTPEEAKENGAVEIQAVNDQTAGPLLYDDKIDILIGAAALTDPFTAELNTSYETSADPENGAANSEGEDGEAGINGSQEIGGEAAPAETAPEVFREMWPENFAPDGSELPEAGQGSATGDENSAGIGTENIAGEEDGAGAPDDPDALPAQEETPTPEPIEHWSFTREYAEGRVITVLHEKEGLANQMDRVIQEMVNSGKMKQITAKYIEN